jgi:hypothetical protein
MNVRVCVYVRVCVCSYGRPACEKRPFFKCVESKESSEQGVLYLHDAVQVASVSPASLPHVCVFVCVCVYCLSVSRDPLSPIPFSLHVAYYKHVS